MTAEFTLHHFTEADVTPVTDFQLRYQAVYPSRSIVPGQAYLSPSFEHGQNVQCATTIDGELVGYSAFYPQGPRAWVHIEVDPGLVEKEQVRDRLFASLVKLARQKRTARLAFQYFPEETDSIAFVKARGAEYSHSIYGMRRSLAEPILTNPVPEGFEIRHLRMQSDNEQQSFLAAYNECFPEAAISLSEWQYLVYSPLWAEGVCIAGMSDKQLAGSVAVYWEPGSPNGYTEYVFTRPDFRGFGLARALLTEALCYLKFHGLEWAQLEVKAENENALKIYHELCYHQTKESQVWEWLDKA